MQNLEIIEQISKYSYRGLILNLQVQVDMLSKSSILNNRKYQEIRKVIEIQYNINHQHIQQLYFYNHDDQYVYIVFEYLSHGSLQNWIKYAQIKENYLKKWTIQLAQIIDYLNSKQLYIDIQINNLYFDKKDDIKLTHLNSIQHKCRKIIPYQNIALILYHCIYKRPLKQELYLNTNYEVQYQNRVIFWDHTEISDQLKQFILKLLNQDIINYTQIINEEWIQY